ATLQAGGQQLDHKHHYFVPGKEIAWTRPAVKVEEAPGSGGLSFIVTSDALARGVYLTAEEEGIFSDNFFDLLPGDSKTVEFFLSGSGEQDFTPSAPRGLEIYTMADYIDENLLSEA
ncbi:glycoside hydrolase family 2 protein, partial [Paenibacillus graminis]